MVLLVSGDGTILFDQRGTDADALSSVEESLREYLADMEGSATP